MKQAPSGASAGRPHWAGHGLTAAVVTLGLASALAGSALQPPVPLDGERQGAVWVGVLLLAACVALGAWRWVQDANQRAIAAVVAMFVLPVMGATSMPDLLHAANADLPWRHALSSEAHRQAHRTEAFVALQTQSLGKHRAAHLLMTQVSAEAPTLQRQISRHQLAALQALQDAGTLKPGMPVHVTIEEGLLGWRFVRRIDTAAR